MQKDSPVETVHLCRGLLADDRTPTSSYSLYIQKMLLSYAGCFDRSVWDVLNSGPADVVESSPLQAHNQKRGFAPDRSHSSRTLRRHRWHARPCTAGISYEFEYSCCNLSGVRNEFNVAACARHRVICEVARQWWCRVPCTLSQTGACTRIQSFRLNDTVLSAPHWHPHWFSYHA